MSYITNWLQNNKVAVCLYLYHTDLWPEFKELLLPLKKYIKLYIGLCKDNPNINDFDEFNHQISIHENRGADVSPFLHQLEQISEPVFVKIHSKKSSWGFKGHINWRQMILNDLISSPKIFKSNLKILLSNSNNCVLCNKVLLMQDREFLNSTKIQEICNTIDIDYSSVRGSDFVAGNMFIGKTDIYKRILGSHIPKLKQLLYNETGKLNDFVGGTYAHSMERIFGYIVKYTNMNFCFPKHKITKILNSQAPNKKYFQLVRVYNNYCYITEDPNVYGLIIDENDLQLNIKWFHMKQEQTQLYNKLNNNTIIKI